MNRRLLWRVLLVLGITFASSISAWYPALADRIGLTGPRVLLEHRLGLGLDLKGGVQFVLRVNVHEALDAGSSATRDEIVAQAKQAVDRRINALGVVEPLIAVQGANRDELLVQLPGVTDVTHARAVLGTTAKLEWRLVEAGPAATRESLGEAISGDSEILSGSAEPGDGAATQPFYRLRAKSDVTGRDIRTARAVAGDRDQAMVAFSLTSDGGGRFATLTSEHIGQRIAIVLDGRVRSVAVIQTAIPGGEGTIQGFSWKEASDLALLLRAGALPVSMTSLGGQYVGPSLGSESISAGIGASAASLVLVAGFMVAYYRRAGVNALVTILANLLVLVGAMAALGAALTLPGIAGLILTIGMGVDSNVLIFERIKEELAAGRSVRKAVAAGFDRVLLTILDTHIASLIAAGFLFQFGSGPIRGFATTLSIGLLTNVFTAVVVSRTLFDVMLARRDATLHLPAFVWSTTRAARQLLAYRKYALGFSAVIVAAGIAVTSVRGLPLGLDFTGGTAVVARFAAPVSEDDVRRAVSGDVVVQRYGADPEHTLLIRAALPADDGLTGDMERGETAIRRALGAAPLPPFEITGTETVGAAIGADLQRKGAYATAASLAGIAAYIAFRFRASFAAGAIVATAHDIAITMAMVSLCGYDLTLNVVAGVLTIAGYSVNDTIVIFDRVREHLRSGKAAPMGVVISTAVAQTLGRTIITAGATFLAVLALFLFGGEVLRGFAFSMLVGIVSGTYSTIFIAAPLAAWLARSKGRATGGSSTLDSVVSRP